MRGIKYKQGQLSISRSLVRFLVIAMLFSVGIAWAVAAVPEGALDAVVGRAETRTAPSTPANVTADAGNVTEVNISTTSQTQAWQGFFGVVNASLVLEDASGDLFYTWNLSSLTGEIYASRDSAVVFGSIFPANNCSIDNALTGEGNSDSVNNTFFPSSNSNSFSIGTITINASSACSTHPYVNSAPTSGDFENIIVTDDPNNDTNPNVSIGNTSIYVSRIDDDSTGFDGGTYDYQLLVPVNRSAGFNTYFFYAEIA